MNRRSFFKSLFALAASWQFLRCELPEMEEEEKTYSNDITKLFPDGPAPLLRYVEAMSIDPATTINFSVSGSGSVQL